MSISPVLPTNDIGWLQRPNRSQERDFGVANRLRIVGDRSFHCQQRQDLEQMILEHVPNGTDFLVEAATSADTELLCHRDLHTCHVIPVPQRFQEGVCEPEVEEILNRLLAEKMVDAVDRRLGKGLMKRAVQFLRRCEVTAKWLFDDESRIRGTSRPSQSSRDSAEQTGWDREIKQRVLGVAEGLA